MEIHDLNTKTLTDPAYVAFDDGTDTYKVEFNDVLEEKTAAAVAAADLTQNQVAFTSGDAASPTAWTNVSVITSGSTLATLFNRISTMVKNVRYIWNLIGTTTMGTTATTITGAIKEHETDISTLNGKTDLSSSFTNSLSTAPESVSIIKKGNVVHVVIMYPSITVANDAQIGTLPSSIKSTSTTILKVVNRTSGAPISGTCWALAGINAIRYYGTAISSTRIMIEGIISLDT